MKPCTPVIPGLDHYELKLGADQEGVEPLPALRSPDGRIVSRWTFTPEERDIIAQGGDLYVTAYTLNHPLQALSLDIAQPGQVEIGQARMDMRLDDEFELRSLAIAAREAKQAMDKRYKETLDGDGELRRLAQIATEAQAAVARKQAEIANPQPQSRLALVN